MKASKIIALFTLVIFSVMVFADVPVRGYMRKNGTYVQPYHRTSPDSNPYNNWSTKGNTNPYTGKPGTQNPQNQYNH